MRDLGPSAWHGKPLGGIAIVVGLGMLTLLSPTFGARGDEVGPTRQVAAEPGRSAAPVATGFEIYARCRACHAIETDRVGPRHCGLFGRRAGSVMDFAYSEAMRTSGIVWGRESLDRFLADPTTVVPGTFMTYAGVSDAGERARLISWLEFSTAPERCQPETDRVHVR